MNSPLPHDTFILTESFIEIAMLDCNRHIPIGALKWLDPDGCHVLTDVKLEDGEDNFVTFWNVALTKDPSTVKTPTACLNTPLDMLLGLLLFETEH